MYNISHMENNKIPAFTADTTSENIDRIAQLFPQAITEKENEDGSTSKAIDFDILKQYLSKELVEGDRERFRLDWPGKKASILKANTPIAKTLRPVRADSVDFDTTENVYIEGDNFEVLKVLQESYLGKIKMIYIDPPYNTGKDFIYKDNFTQDKSEYEDELEIRDEEGGKLIRNTDTNGRYHSDWLSMMQERLLVARDLLTDDGVIFISIDDNEQANLKKLCDEIFGEDNFVNKFVWVNNLKGRQIQGSGAAGTHELIYVYSRNIFSVKEFIAGSEYLKSIMPSSYKGFDYETEEDAHGKYIATNELYNSNSIFNEQTRPNLVYDIYYRESDGDIKIELVSDNHLHDGYAKIRPHANSNGSHKYHAYRWSKNKVLAESYNLKFVKTGDTFRVYTKRRDFDSTIAKDLVTDLTTSTGSQDLKPLKLDKLFDFPKPVKLVEFITKVAADKDSLVVDFFSGSATTAHAVMQLNAEDGGNRKFIMAQIPESTPEDSEARKAGYNTIPEIARERIKRAGAKIRQDFGDKLAERETPLDTGFRVFKIDTPIFKDVEKHPTEFDQENLFGAVDNIKEDRTPEDILTHTILRLGLTLDVSIETKKIDGHDVYFVEGNALVACFDTNISNAVIEAIAEAEPLKAVFRDAGFAEDKDRINIETLFKQKSPNTDVRVI